MYTQGDFESAIADIQLLGNVDQVKLAHAFAQENSSNGRGSLDELLNSLRLELRRELELEIDGIPRIRPFRIIPNSNRKNR